MNPDLARTPKWAAPIGGWFWSTHGCNQLAQNNEFDKLTERINGGLFGAEERVEKIKQFLKVMRG